MKRFTPASGEFSAADQDFKADFEAAAADKPNPPSADEEGGPGLMTPEKDAAIKEEFTKSFNEEEPSVTSGSDEGPDEFEQAGVDGEAALQEAVKKADEAAAQYGQKLSFKQAFKKARDEGLKVFDWEGKKYTTDVAGAKPAAPKGLMDPAPAAKAETPLGMDKKPVGVVEEMAGNPTDPGEMLSTKSRKPEPKPEPAKRMGWNDVKPLSADENARSIYGRG